MNQHHNLLLIGSTYIRLLTTRGMPKDEDYGAALELIHGGYAVGKYHTTSSGDPNTADPIDAFFSFAPTTKGRLFAAQLLQEEQQKTLRARLMRWGIPALTALGGAILATAVAVGSDAAKAALGLCS